MDDRLFKSLEWRCIGPHRGGRCVTVAGHPTDAGTFYFGGCGGGVWKTTNGGSHWLNVSDGFFKTAAVGAVAVSNSHPEVVYAGTGEACIRSNVSHGDGVYRSDDGGRSWRNLGLDATRHISRVLIHPTNPDLVYVAALGHAWGPNPERGIYRSNDGGETWELVLHKSDRAGAADLTMDPNNPRVLYAALWQGRRYPHAAESGGEDTGVWRSMDGGDTWTELTRNKGLPTGLLGRIGITASPAQPGRVWALVEAEDGALFRSDDSGATWQRINDSRELRRWPSSYMHIVADTQDPDTVYVPSYDFLKSSDGGKTFAAMPMAHGDHHAVWIDPKNPKRMIEGNDGGATVTLNAGASWSTLNNQPTACLFGLAIDDNVPYRVYAAQNDSTHVSTPSRTRQGAISWMDNEVIPGGEGGQTAVKPDGSVVYAADRAGIDRVDRRTGQAANISVWPDDQFTFATKDVKYRFFYTLPVDRKSVV